MRNVIQCEHCIIRRCFVTWCLSFTFKDEEDSKEGETSKDEKEEKSKDEKEDDGAAKKPPEKKVSSVT